LSFIELTDLVIVVRGRAGALPPPRTVVRPDSVNGFAHFQKEFAMAWTAICYRDFYDVPRLFLTAYHGEQYLFDCPFDEELNDYPDRYRVYQMPALAEAELQGSWEHLPERASRFL
jgi:hypothetical protein